MNDPLDFLRVLNLILGLGVGAVFVVRLLRRWWVLSDDARQDRLGFTLMVLATGYGSAEAIHQQVPTGTRTAIFTAALFFAALSCIPQRWKRRAADLKRARTVRRTTPTPKKEEAQ